MSALTSMKPKTWYLCYMKSKLLHLDAGKYYIRRLSLTRPLAVGQVWILFHPKKGISLRLSEGALPEEFLDLYPNNVNPMPAPEERNALVESQFKEWLVHHPVAKRFSPEVSLEVADYLDSIKGRVGVRGSVQL